MRVRICGVNYKINEREDHFSSDIHFGDVDYKTCEIQINNKLTSEVKQETLCHEILHAMLVHIGRGDLSNDETFVQSLGNAIYQTFEPRVENETSV